MPVLAAMVTYFSTPFVIAFAIFLSPWWWLVLLLMWLGYIGVLAALG